MNKKWYYRNTYIERRIAKYAEEVNGFPVTDENLLYWRLLPVGQARQVWAKWRKLAIEKRQEISETGS